MIKIKGFISSLRGKAILAATFFIVIFMALTGYTILSREKALYLRDRENQARALTETAGINFTNAYLYQEVGLIEETGVIDRYITDLLSKERRILTIIIFDNSGMVIGHCHLFEHGKFYKDAKEILAHNATFVREVNDKDRGPILEAITPLMVGARRIATLRIEFSLKDFYEKLTNLGKRIFLLTIAAISGSTFLMVLGINAMVRPIRRLSKAMDNIDYGKYDSISDVPRRDEIGYLQRSFAGMVKRLKEADLQWENTFNSITDLVTIHDMDFRIVKANTALAQRLGITTDELKGRKCWEVFHNGSGPFPTCPHAATLKTGEPATIEMEYSHMKGIFLTTTFPVLNERKEVVGTVHVAKDITQEKRFQEKLIQSEKMAAMGQMASGIAHEINNPLNSILGYATYLLETMDGPSGKDELNRIAKGAARCKEIVKRFLDLARETPLEMKPIDMEKVVEEVLSMCNHALTSQGIEVIKNIGTDLWIDADKGHIEEVLINIVLNACDAMSAGGRLSIKAHRENSFIKVNISDTGCGIPQENLQKIFDPFFTTKEPGRGTGLGLAVSHTIIKSHGGAIDCESIMGKGTTFIITLPLTLPLSP
ncbi:MAG: ATP-binding protein [Nitrospirota bacterium]